LRSEDVKGYNFKGDTPCSEDANFQEGDECAAYALKAEMGQ
jgi:hypothetical protein